KSVANGSEPARIALHTLASAVLVKAQGGNAAAGAAGGFVAASGSERLSAAFYNTKSEEMKKRSLLTSLQHRARRAVVWPQGTAPVSAVVRTPPGWRLRIIL
ncbi:hypothetical protein ROL05_17900, partial [Cronobacter dublinensis]|nr:hypothetical protein [Cronobacter dublinensis]